MKIDAIDVVKMGGVVTGKLSFSLMTPKVRSAVEEAVTSGGLYSRFGAASFWYTTLMETANLPGFTVRNQGKIKWPPGYTARGYIVPNNLPSECIQAMSDWWKVDRVDWRLQDQEEYSRFVKDAENNSYAKGHIVEPEWESVLQHNHTVPAMSGTKGKPFAGISQALRESSGYKDKAEHALKLIREGATLTFNLKK